MLGAVDVVSLGYRTDVALRVLGGSEIADHVDHIVVRTAANPGFWWGNFMLLAAPPPGETASWLSKFAAKFPGRESRGVRHRRHRRLRP